MNYLTVSKPVLLQFDALHAASTRSAEDIMAIVDEWDDSTCVNAIHVLEHKAVHWLEHPDTPARQRTHQCFALWYLAEKTNTPPSSLADIMMGWKHFYALDDPHGMVASAACLQPLYRDSLLSMFVDLYFLAEPILFETFLSKDLMMRFEQLPWHAQTHRNQSLMQRFYPDLFAILDLVLSDNEWTVQELQACIRAWATPQPLLELPVFP